MMDVIHGIWVVLPPWIYATLVTWLGRWGERHLAHTAEPPDGKEAACATWREWGAIAVTNLVFLALLPTTILSFIHLMLPFGGARAGLAVGVAAFLFGCVPGRLFDRCRRGWDYTLWAILIDLVRVGGALTLVGWLVAR